MAFNAIYSGVWVCLGQVLPIIEAACGLHWYNICLIGIIFPTIGLLIIPFIPESPSWFVVKVRWDYRTIFLYVALVFLFVLIHF